MDITADIIIWEWGLTGEWKGSKNLTGKGLNDKDFIINQPWVKR